MKSMAWKPNSSCCAARDNRPRRLSAIAFSRAPCTLTTVMSADLSGADLVTVAHTVAGVQSKLLVRPEIKQPEDLRGKKHRRLRLRLPGRFSRTLHHKKIWAWSLAGMSSCFPSEPSRKGSRLSTTGLSMPQTFPYPADVQASAKDSEFCGMPNRKCAYPSMSVVTRRKCVTEDRDTVMRMVKAHVEAIHYLKANKEASTKDFRQVSQNQRPRTARGSYEIYRNDFISVPYPITQGLQPTYEYVAAQRPGDMESQTRSVHGLKLHRGAGQKRFYQTAL